MIHKTKAIVLRAIKYGETSLVVSAYTELFGIQSYIINGVRKSGKKSSGSTNHFQSGALLDIVVYHLEQKNLQRIKEYKWSYIYQSVFSDVIKNAVLLYCIELLQKTIKQPEANADFFNFIEAAFVELDKAEPAVVANFPLYFSLQLMPILGLRIQDNYSKANTILNLMDGTFNSSSPEHPHFLDETGSYYTSELLKVMQPNELSQISLNHTMRRSLLQGFQLFYALHLPDFGTMKSLAVLQEIVQ